MKLLSESNWDRWYTQTRTYQVGRKTKFRITSFQGMVTMSNPRSVNKVGVFPAQAF